MGRREGGDRIGGNRPSKTEMRQGRNRKHLQRACCIKMLNHFQDIYRSYLRILKGDARSHVFRRPPTAVVWFASAMRLLCVSDSKSLPGLMALFESHEQDPIPVASLEVMSLLTIAWESSCQKTPSVSVLGPFGPAPGLTQSIYKLLGLYSGNPPSLRSGRVAPGCANPPRAAWQCPAPPGCTGGQVSPMSLDVYKL